MKLEIVNIDTHGFVCTCLKCEKRIEPQEKRYADLEGQPFKAYYCDKCAKEEYKGREDELVP